jgi:hypothetical protein
MIKANEIIKVLNENIEYHRRKRDYRRRCIEASLMIKSRLKLKVMKYGRTQERRIL